jgi:hypothetical protein
MTKSTFKISFYFLSMLLFVFNLISCKKDNVNTYDSLILGRWNLTKVIQKSMIKDLTTPPLPVIIQIDTTILKNVNSSTTVYFYVDTLTYQSNLNNQSFTYYSNLKYKIDKQTLISDPEQFAYAHSICTIVNLTNSDMTLYSTDTTNRSPLVVNEKWSYLSKTQ